MFIAVVRLEKEEILVKIVLMLVSYFKEYALKNVPSLMLRRDQEDTLSVNFVISLKDFFRMNKKINVCVHNNILLLHYLGNVLLVITLA